MYEYEYAHDYMYMYVYRYVNVYEVWLESNAQGKIS